MIFYRINQFHQMLLFLSLFLLLYSSIIQSSIYYDEIFPLKAITFEGYEFNCPNNVFVVLRRLYRDFLVVDTYESNAHQLGCDLSIQQIRQIAELVGDNTLDEIYGQCK